jgi:hypothetical protein
MEALRAELEKAKKRESDAAAKQKTASDATKKKRAAASKAAAAAPAPTPAAAAPTQPAKPAKPAYTPAAATAAAPAPAAPQGATGKGELRVNSRPWSNINVDGKPAGRTPEVMDLSVGRHTVALTTSDGRRHEETLTIRANKKETRCWNFDLEAACKR